MAAFIEMENFFNPGLKIRPAVHIGSQTHRAFRGNVMEQAWEGFHLAGACNDDVVVLRNFNEEYIKYWESLFNKVRIINVSTNQYEAEVFLSEFILNRKDIIELIKSRMEPQSSLLVFLPTFLEEKLAQTLNLPLHGSPIISQKYGTKDGVRKLAEKCGIKMPQGFICKKVSEIIEAFDVLSKHFEIIIIKHGHSISGKFSKIIKRTEREKVHRYVNDICVGKFREGDDVVVVEGWIENKLAVCAHVEILPKSKPIICASWKQVIDGDGVSYIGAEPLLLSGKLIKALIEEIHKLANVLYDLNAVGSYAPDFILVPESNKSEEEGTWLLLELNARVPFTAFPLEIIKQLKGRIGSGFATRHIHVSVNTSANTILQVLREHNLLISEGGCNIKGVVPYNVGLLPWGIFDIVAIADTYEEAAVILSKVKKIFRDPK